MPSVQKSTLDIVAQFEGLRLSAYRDQRGVLTIGYGCTRPNGRPVVQNQTCTEAQARIWLSADLQTAARAVRAIQHPLTQHQFDALCSLAYNIGIGAFDRSVIPARIEAGNLVGAADAILEYDHVGGKVDAGLLHRRRIEHDLFLEA